MGLFGMLCAGFSFIGCIIFFKACCTTQYDENNVNSRNNYHCDLLSTIPDFFAVRYPLCPTVTQASSWIRIFQNFVGQSSVSPPNQGL